MKYVLKCLLLIPFLAFAGTSNWLEPHNLSFNGELSGKFKYALSASTSNSGKIKSLKLRIGDVDYKVPMQKLRGLTEPHLGKIELIYNSGGGIVFRNDSSKNLNVAHHITLIIPFLEEKECTDNDESYWDFSSLTVEFTLEGEVYSSEIRRACES